MRRNKAWFFRNNALLDGAVPEAISLLEQCAEVVTLRKKQNIWTPGDPADRVFWVRSGIVKISKVTEEGRELTLHFHTKEALFGEVALFASSAHNSVAEAYEDTTLYAVSREDLLRVLRKSPELTLRITHLIAERRTKLENRIGSLLFKTAHSRLANLFLDLAEDFGVRDSRGVIVNIKLTHKEMASLIGATRETVSFAILDLRKSGLILTESKRVIILDEDGLKELVGS